MSECIFLVVSVSCICVSLIAFLRSILHTTKMSHTHTTQYGNMPHTQPQKQSLTHTVTRPRGHTTHAHTHTHTHTHTHEYRSHTHTRTQHAKHAHTCAKHATLTYNMSNNCHIHVTPTMSRSMPTKRPSNQLPKPKTSK